MTMTTTKEYRPLLDLVLNNLRVVPSIPTPSVAALESVPEEVDAAAAPIENIARDRSHESVDEGSEVRSDDGDDNVLPLSLNEIRHGVKKSTRKKKGVPTVTSAVTPFNYDEAVTKAREHSAGDTTSAPSFTFYTASRGRGKRRRK